MKPFCINEKCENFLPEDKRGYYKKPQPVEEAEGEGQNSEIKAQDSEAEQKAPAKKTAAKKTAEKKTAAKKTTAKKTTTRAKSKKE